MLEAPFVKLPHRIWLSSSAFSHSALLSRTASLTFPLLHHPTFYWNAMAPQHFPSLSLLPADQTYRVGRFDLLSVSIPSHFIPPRKSIAPTVRNTAQIPVSHPSVGPLSIFPSCFPLSSYTNLLPHLPWGTPALQISWRENATFCQDTQYETFHFLGSPRGICARIP